MSTAFYRARFVSHFARLQQANELCTDAEFRNLAINLINGLMADPLIKPYVLPWSN